MAAVPIRRVFSGLQPTGVPHLGNYLGAIVNWVRLQEEADAARAAGTPHAGVVYCVVDLHAMTMPYDPAELHAACRLTAASLIACGIDPSRSVLFRQSAVREHTELAWVLGCGTPLGSLARMTQFKDKSRGKGAAALAGGGGTRADAVPLGLLSYPVLQAADILLYRATHVPVGEDQHQHLELAREAAAGFNRRFADGRPVLPPPATVSLGSPVARVMSLRDGTRKMSKSDADDGSRINLTDSADAIADKVRRARTDSVAGFSYDPTGRPDKSNLLGIFAAVTGESVEGLSARYATASAADFKRELADALVAKVTPIGARIAQLMADAAGGAPAGAARSVAGSVAGAAPPTTVTASPASSSSGSYIDAVLAQGGERAAALAAETMGEVRALTGYR